MLLHDDEKPLDFFHCLSSLSLMMIIIMIRVASRQCYQETAFIFIHIYCRDAATISFLK